MVNKSDSKIVKVRAFASPEKEFFKVKSGKKELSMGKNLLSIILK